MLLSLVVAASTNNAIGLKNRLLWRLPNDTKFFKNITWAMPVIMGRKTLDSLGKPLQGRLNIVITRQTNWKPEGVTVVHTLQEAADVAAKENYKEAFVIGGGEIYREAMAVADKIYLTRVDAVLDGDTYFPVIDQHQWRMISEESFAADDKHAYAYHFQLWEKNKA
jgi:dihydrofolate reductase